MKALQKLIQEFCTNHDLNNTPIEFRFIDLVSELGEVGKDLLISSSYGSKPLKISPSLGEELGDTFFSLIVLANQTKIDLELELKKVLSKYEARISEKDDPGSK